MPGQNQGKGVRRRRGRGMKLQWGPQQWSGRRAVALAHGVGVLLSSCVHKRSPSCGGVWWKALTCSWFLPAGAWVQVLPSPELREGQAVVLSCQVPRGVLEGTSYRWYRDGQPLQESTSATIHFAAITFSQAGAYHCQAQAPGSATMSLAAPVSLHVSCKHFDPIHVSWGRREPSA